MVEEVSCSVLKSGWDFKRKERLGLRKARPVGECTGRAVAGWGGQPGWFPNVAQCLAHQQCAITC